MGNYHDILSIIDDKKAILSGEIAKVLVSKYGQNETASRKAIQRFRLNAKTKKSVVVLNDLFSERQSLFLSTKIDENEKYDLILKALKRKGKQFFYILHALKLHFGIIPENKLASYSVNPIKPIGKHVLIDKQIQKLKNKRLLTINNDWIKISSKLFPNIKTKKSKAIDYAKRIVLNDFNNLFRNIGLISYNSSSFHNEFFKFQFNFVGISYSVLPNYDYKTKKMKTPSFVVSDIILKNGTRIQKNDISFFIKKIEILKLQKKIPNFIPFLLVDSKINKEALMSLKENGISLEKMGLLY